MVYENLANPFMSQRLGKNIEDLKSLVKSTMDLVHAQYTLNNQAHTDEEFQSNVISKLRKFVKPDFFYDLNLNLSVWVSVRSGTIKQYITERLTEKNKDKDLSDSLNMVRYMLNNQEEMPSNLRTYLRLPKSFEIPDTLEDLEFAIQNELEGKKMIPHQKFLKVIVKCNSKGDTSEILTEDLEPWLDSVKTHLKAPENRKYFESSSTRKQVLANLKSMLAFPVSSKETLILNHLSEEGINSLLENEPEKYLPKGALLHMKNGGNLDNILIVTSNVYEYSKGKNKFRTEGRLKASECLKWAKYISGIRSEPHLDGIGLMEVVPELDLINAQSQEVLSLKNDKTFRHEQRYSFKVQKVPTDTDMAYIKNASENAIMQLLKTSYLSKEGIFQSEKVKKFKKDLIYGDWIDMNLRSTKAPIEIQVKDAFGYLLYNCNSPFGHNSKAYNGLRENELHKTVEIGGRHYAVDQITRYVSNEILSPAFHSMRIQ